jgi:hypothetical protein
VTEDDFQKQVTDLATVLGWEWFHARPAMTSKGWRTPVSGSLGKGWPDLLLVRQRDGGIVAAELKREGAKTTPEQDHVLKMLTTAGVPTYVWMPSDFDEIAQVLR